LEPEIVETTIFKNSTVSIALKPRRKEKLQEYHIILNKLFTDDRILLFLPNIVNAKIITPTAYKESKKNEEDYFIGKEPLTIPDSIRQWINKEIDDNESVVPEKYYDIENSIIQFATKRISNQIEKTSNSVLYNYLPTKVNLGFDFLINGDFIPDGTREFFHNIKWNDFLIEQAGLLFLKWIKSIGEKKDESITASYLFKRSYPIIIPDFSILRTQIIDERNKHLLSSFKRGFKLGLIGSQDHQPISFIPTQLGTLETLSNILIDKTGIANLLKDDFVKLTGIAQKIIHKEVAEGTEKIESLITEYGTGCIYTIDNLKTDFKKVEFQEWLKLPDNNFKFLKHLFNSNDATIRQMIETENIILSKTNELHKASDLLSEIPEEVFFIGSNTINLSLRALLAKEKIELKLKPFHAVVFYKENLKSFNSLLTNENNIFNTWNFIYDNWSAFKIEEEIKKSLGQLNIVCKPTQEGVLNIRPILSVYIPNLDEPEPKRKKSVIFHQI